MKLRVFLPAADSTSPREPLAWMLMDSRGHVLRRDHGPIEDMPKADTVEAVLPAERVLFARLKLPRVNAGTIRELLPYAVEDRLLADPAHIHAVPGPRNARDETLVAVVDREWLGDRVQTLARAGLRPRTAWCESALLAGGGGDWHVVLDQARGMLVDDAGASATFDRGDGLPLALRIALDEAAGRGERPQSVTVHLAHGASLPDLAAWAQEAGVAFRQGDAWETIAAGEPDREAIDLLQGEMAHRPRAWRGIPRAAVVFAAVLALLQIVFTGADAWRLEHEVRALEARREAIFRDAFPEARVVIDPELQMSRNLADLRRTRGLAAGDDFMAQLTRLGRERNGPVKAIEYANGKAVAR
jgi:general secretion pathway protein L